MIDLLQCSNCKNFICLQPTSYIKALNHHFTFNLQMSKQKACFLYTSLFLYTGLSESQLNRNFDLIIILQLQSQSYFVITWNISWKLLCIAIALSILPALSYNVCFKKTVTHLLLYTMCHHFFETEVTMQLVLVWRIS